MTYFYQIFQLDVHKPELLEKKYHSYNDIVAKYGEVNFSEYTKTYEGELKYVEFVNEEDICDALFEKFNLYHPEDFHGHSLSVGDIVKIEDKKYYCDWYGWKKI